MLTGKKGMINRNSEGQTCVMCHFFLTNIFFTDECPFGMTVAHLPEPRLFGGATNHDYTVIQLLGRKSILIKFTGNTFQ